MQTEIVKTAASQSELTTSKAKHFFVRALADFSKKANGKKDLLDTQNAMVALQTIAAHYPSVDSVEAAQLACIYIGQQWDKNLELCEPATILGAFMQLCNLGIVLRTVQPLAYLVNKGGKCTIFIGVDGYQLLSRRRYPNLTLRTEFVTKSELPALQITKGKDCFIKHVLDPLRDYDDAVAMYAVLNLDASAPIHDIVLMNTKERDKYVRLHKGGVWNQWGATMWATKIAKKIFKSIGLSDPDGTVATINVDNDTIDIDITQCDYEDEFEKYLAEVQASLEELETKEQVRQLYIAFCERARQLGENTPNKYANLFTNRGEKLL